MSDCVFCGIVEGSIPSTKVHEDDRTVAIMDINPATDGHLLVLPKRHARDIFALMEEDGVAVWRTVQRMAGVIDAALSPAGLTVIQANRPASWQTVFHFHVHLIPRYPDDPLVLPWRPTPGDRERIAEVAGRLQVVSSTPSG
jgi:histidine triad (HIT) family protein